ncbi:hypothetical protein ACTWPB_16780 [Nocardia sp. IBHARD005]|uniref:hypothetical protein n=1 Tax=Nocardia sp. IBHARD005 TaxID=3457765 RepID=UPI0040586A7C
MERDSLVQRIADPRDGRRSLISLIDRSRPLRTALIAAITGGTGFRLAGDAAMLGILAEKRRMPFIAGNGLLVLIPSAITLARRP